MRAWLHEQGIELEERDFFQERFSEEELRRLLQGTRLPEVFSWSSPSFKALGVGRDNLDDERLLHLMLQEPRLIRRPLLRVGERLIIGGDQKALEEAFKQR